MACLALSVALYYVARLAYPFALAGTNTNHVHRLACHIINSYPIGPYLTPYLTPDNPSQQRASSDARPGNASAQQTTRLATRVVRISARTA